MRLSRIGQIGWISMLFGSLASRSVHAQLRLGDIWQSGMVIQRDQPIHIWGWATPGATVQLRLGNEHQLVTVGVDSTWLATFRSRPTSKKPDTLTAQSNSERIQLTDIWLGDVWLCAGQSNMAFPLMNDQFAPQTLKQTYNPMLRLLNRLPVLTTYNQPYRPDELSHLQSNQFYRSVSWTKADSLSARLFSAVDYYAGARLQHELGIPIGLIHVAVGGSPTEAWIPASARYSNPVLTTIFTGNWLTNPVLDDWCIQRAHQNLDSLLKAGYAIPGDSLGYNHPFKPGFLFDAALKPLLRLGLKGILWYQGESNALSLDRVRQHEQLFPQLLLSWRMAWQQPDMPVYFCQLSSIGTERGYQSTYWPLFRDGQRQMAERLPYVGMAITSDVGHRWDVHPTNKRTVGERLAREILVKTYGHNRLLSPAVGQIVRRKHQWIIRLTQTGKKLRTSDGGPPQNFSIGDAIEPKRVVRVRIAGKTLRLPIIQTEKQVYLYYGWQPFSQGTIVNAEGLPLSTFRILLP